MFRLRTLFLLLSLVSLPNSAQAQVVNLLKNPNADDGVQSWRAHGSATVEQCQDGPCFVLRNGGYFIQDVTLPEDAVGQYALLVGRASAEAVRNGSITGEPSLYGYMMNAGDPSGGRIYAYLQGQRMLSSSTVGGEWVKLWGVFKIVPGTVRISFFLKQALRHGSPHDGAATRFDDLALLIFPDEQSARAFVGDPYAGAIGPKTVPAKCPLSRASIPSIYGLHVGMTLDQVLLLFPGNEKDRRVQQAVELFQTKNVSGGVSLIFSPHAQGINYELQDVENFFLVFQEEKLYRIDVNYSRPGGNTVDTFIEARRHLLNMPEPAGWNSVVGSRGGKYLICDGIEVRFFYAHAAVSRPSRIEIVDTAVEGKSLKEPSLQKRSAPPTKN